MIRRLAILLVGVSAPAAAQTAYPPATPTTITLSTPLCSIVSIPSGNNVANTATETAFTSTCYIAPGASPGAAVRLDSRFLFSVAATIPTLQGKVYLATSATPNLATCVGANTCVVLLDTTPVGGLAAGSNLYANADVSLTLVSATQIEAAGQLNFQTTANAVIAIGVMSATSPTSAPVTIPWNIITNGSYVVKSAKWSAAATNNAIQLRQDTAK